MGKDYDITCCNYTKNIFFFNGSEHKREKGTKKCVIKKNT